MTVRYKSGSVSSSTFKYNGRIPVALRSPGPSLSSPLFPFVVSIGSVLRPSGRLGFDRSARSFTFVPTGCSLPASDSAAFASVFVASYPFSGRVYSVGKRLTALAHGEARPRVTDARERTWSRPPSMRGATAKRRARDERV